MDAPDSSEPKPAAPAHPEEQAGPVPDGGGSRGRGWMSVGVLVSVVSLAAVVVWALDQPAPSFPTGGAELLALGGAVAIYALVTALRGERWHFLLTSSGHRVSRADSQGLTVISYAGNNVLPARGGDLVRLVLMARRSALNAREVLGTVLLERLLDVVALFALFVLLGYGVLSSVTSEEGDEVLLISLAVGAVAVVAAGAGLLAVRRGLLVRLREFLRPVGAIARGLGRREIAALITATFVIWALEALTYYAIADATDLPISFLEMLYLIGLTGMLVAIPAGPGNAGTLDAGVLIALEAIGGADGQALSFLLMLRFVLLVPITIAGLAVLIGRYGGWSKVRGQVARRP